MEKNRLFNIYLGVVSFFSIIAIAITLWVIITMFGRFFIISDDEYIASRYYYKLDNCEDSDIKEEEVESCKIEARKKLITERRFRLKESAISAWGWLVVFLLLFGFHYPKFKRFKE